MVFIIKIPNKNKDPDGTESASPSQTNNSSAVESNQAEAEPSLPLPSTSIAPTTPLSSPPTSSFFSPNHQQYQSQSKSHSSEPRRFLSPASLDILLPPAVLNHQFVRSNDKSLIVERPERIHAVLLGIASAWSMDQVERENRGQGGSGGREVMEQKAILRNSSRIKASSSSSLESGSTSIEEDERIIISQSTSPFHLLKTTRSLSLNPPHPSVAYIHAHQDEMFPKPGPTIRGTKKDKERRAKEKGKTRGVGMGEEEGQKLEVESNEELQLERVLKGINLNEESCSIPEKKNPNKAPEMVSHSQYLGLLCSDAPHSPPIPRPRTKHKAKKSTIKIKERSTSTSVSSDESSSSSSSDEEEGNYHPSEVPLHLPQGDLYLRGPKTNNKINDEVSEEDSGGSSEAIRHSLGSCAEAVDRIVWGAQFKNHLQSFQRNKTSTESPTDDLILQSSKVIKLPLHGSLILPSSTSSIEPITLPSSRSFVLTRPPGHHCGSGFHSSEAPNSSLPSGFCWVNNVLVASAHAHLEHGINKIVVLDIDLHHGNGSQSLAWRINDEGQRIRGEMLARREAEKMMGGNGEAEPLQIFYGSLHDIESYPCEDGNSDLIRDASTCIAGNHGQWIWNVHLETYDSNSSSSFKDLYSSKYSTLLSKAREFLASTPSGSSSLPPDPSKSLIFISAGFDASIHELPGMQRHEKNVPTSFYRTFTQDSIKLADEFCEGKIVGVLEGGYSDRALSSGIMSLLDGFCEAGELEGKDSVKAEGLDEVENRKEFSNENLLVMEKFCKKFLTLQNPVYHSNQSQKTVLKIPKSLETGHPWLRRTFETFEILWDACKDQDQDSKGGVSSIVVGDGDGDGDSSLSNTPSNGRSLRDRTTIKSPGRFDGSPNTIGKVVRNMDSTTDKKTSKPRNKAQIGGETPDKVSSSVSVDRGHAKEDLASKNYEIQDGKEREDRREASPDFIESLNSMRIES